MAIGMDRNTGKPLDGVAHLRQSIFDILATRIGTRVMLRDYGSNLPEMIDLPTNRTTIAAMRADIVKALDRWEPRVRVNRVHLNSISVGSVTFDLYVTYLPNGEAVALEGVTIS